MNHNISDVLHVLTPTVQVFLALCCTSLVRGASCSEWLVWCLGANATSLSQLRILTRAKHLGCCLFSLLSLPTKLAAGLGLKDALSPPVLPTGTVRDTPTRWFLRSSFTPNYLVMMKHWIRLTYDWSPLYHLLFKTTNLATFIRRLIVVVIA